MQRELTDMSMKEEIITIISQVCELLGDLASDVSALLHTFAKLSEEIKRLVDIRKRIEKPAGINLGFTRVNPFGKKAKFVEANKKDEAYMTRLFFQQVMRMKQVCLGIHVLSKLYAGIINDVINYGFAEALRASYDDLGQTSTAMIVAGRKKRMKKWHDQAKLVCSERNREAARSFQDQLRAMGNGSMDQMPQFERTVGTVPWLGTPSPFGSATPAGMGLGADFMATFPTPGLSVPEYPPGTARRAFSPQRPLSPQPAIDPRIYISPPASVRRRDSFDS
ncbi:hypothetical protein B0T24DRAFT_414419 [Lasiosphaeria ovina]|uniref:Uncharacterized protein n=1 Tax=Lasiosphaeria ovina TaxID=92902 RepID=A0AAE0JXY7_9PEZI|nr:hypothetical protein B0T24DRAFT_414419 [Lasiosphaeria ovina]